MSKLSQQQSRRRLLAARKLAESRQAESPIIRDLHEGQRRFLYARNDRGELATSVALLSARRHGKTEGALRYAADLCQRVPRARCVFVYQLRTDSKDIAWPLLLDLADRYRWDCRMYSVELACKFGNGSIIKLYGADDPRRHRQFRGQRNDLVVIDEAQNFTSDLEQLVQWMMPGLLDRRGRVFMLGTPGQVCQGYYWEVCNDEHPQWVVIKASPKENPHTRIQLEEYEQELLRSNPSIEQEPFFRREYRGEWVVDTRKNVIKLDPEMNYLYRWQPHADDRYVLGIDWGDATTAFVCAVWNPSQYKYMVYLESSELHDVKIADMVEEIRRYMARYPKLALVCDPGGMSKTIVKELRETHALPLQNAEKEDRVASIELLNTDVMVGDIKLFNRDEPSRPQDMTLAKQWRELVWIENRYTKKREESQPRHLHDAALYARRWCYKHLYTPPKAALPEYGSHEYWQGEAKRTRDELSKRIERRNRHGLRGVA